MAVLSRALGTVARPFNTLIHCGTASVALFTAFLLLALVGRTSVARSHSYDNNSVPPVGSKLEQEVVSAIKVRAHSLNSNTTNPSDILDSPDYLFTDNGKRTSVKFRDPRHFFTSITSKNLARKGDDGATQQQNVGTNGNSSSSDFQKVIIFRQNKSFQTHDGIDAKVEPLKGRGAIKAEIVAKVANESFADQKKSEGKIDSKDREEVLEKPVPEKQKRGQDVGAPHREQNEKEDSEEKEKEKTPKVDIAPSTVISDHGEKQANVSTEKLTKEVSDPDKQIQGKEDKEKKETIDDEPKDKNITSDEPEKDKGKTKEKIHKDVETQTEDDAQSKTEEPVDDKEVKDKSEKEKTDSKEKEKVGKDTEMKDGDKSKKDKDEGEEGLDEKEKPLVEQEESDKPSESKKKDRKKTDGTEEGKKTEAEEGEDTEQSNDTLETYSQFTQRVSAEKKNDATTNGHGTNGHSKGSKVKGKNYASPDCGAKLLTSNPEASHSSKVIHPNKDEYMLNKCQDKIWFIIELCESIRPQKFDIANFELFSNLPKDIQVFGSHRYQSRDWTSLGKFKGQEGNRGIQSFRIETDEFFKFIKVEVTSNYGSEFYCPISTFQIYGLSEFEVIDSIEDQAEDADDDNEPFVDPAEETTKKKSKEEGKQGVIPTVLKNMFSGVMDVIKRGYRPVSSASEPGENCYSLHPKYAVESNLCPMAGSLNYILSCYNAEYVALMQQPFVSSTVKNSSFCRQLALTMCAEPDVNDSIVYDTTCNNSYVCVMLSPKHVLAMCFMQDPQIMNKGISCEGTGTQSENFSATPELLPSIEAPAYVKNADINTSSITRADALDTNISESNELQKKKSSPEVIKDAVLPVKSNTDKKKQAVETPVSESSSMTENEKSSPKEVKVNVSKEKVVKESEPETVARITKPEESVESEGSGMGGIDISEEELPPSSPEETGTITPTPPPPPPPPASSSVTQPSELKVSNSPTNKESVVVRLSNKIKALEYNMSISSQYLEELSRRYKRQMEEMQKQAYETDQHHQRDIEKLEEQLANVSSILRKFEDERERLADTVVEQHVLLMVVEVIVLCMVFTMCSRRRNYRDNVDYGHTRRNQTPSEDSPGSIVDLDGHSPNADSHGRVRVRRRSVDSITSERNSRLRQRRPSEEALNISGTYQDLLIIEPAIPILMDPVSDRKKKRKSNSGSLKRSKSNASIVDKSCSARRAKRLEKLNLSSAGVLFCGDEVDSKSSVPPEYNASNPLDCYGLMHHDPLVNNGVFYDYTENLSHFQDRPLETELHLVDGVPNDFDTVSKRHSVACSNCDSIQKKEKLSKSSSVSSAPEKLKSTHEKTKKVKKLKKAKVKDSSSLYSDSCQTQSHLPSYSKEYYYSKPNGLTYHPPIETYDSYYYNGHGAVHFSDDTKGPCDRTYSHMEEVSMNGGYSNGIDSCEADPYRYGEFPHANHDTHNVSEKKKSSPKVKSKVKLRSDNWEWYSSQHVGTSSTETVSTCSDSSGKNRKEKEPVDYEKIDDKKGKRKKKSKSKPVVLLEEEALLDTERGT